MHHLQCQGYLCQLYIRTLSINFLLGNEEEIHVKLNDVGKRIYHNRIVSRPIKDEALSTNDEYVFHCTNDQAFLYFYSFGSNVEIISPKSLRDRVIESHKEALSIYKKASK